MSAFEQDLEGVIIIKGYKKIGMRKIGNRKINIVFVRVRAIGEAFALRDVFHLLGHRCNVLRAAVGGENIERELRMLAYRLLEVFEHFLRRELFSDTAACNGMTAHRGIPSEIFKIVVEDVPGRDAAAGIAAERTMVTAGFD